MEVSASMYVQVSSVKGDGLAQTFPRVNVTRTALTRQYHCYDRKHNNTAEPG